VFSQIYDPCDVTRITDGNDPATRAANCATILGALGVDVSTFTTNTQFNTTTQPGQSGGNENLVEEKAKTWTVGMTVRPEFAPSLALSLDWYEIKLTNAVSTATAQQVINLCVDSPLPNNYCDSVTRLTEADGNYDPGYISSYLVGPQNVAEYTTSGLDLGLNWTFMPAPDWGRFRLNTNAGYLKSLTFISLPGAAPRNDKEARWAPKWTVSSDLTWDKGNFLVNYGLNFFSKTRRFSAVQIANNPDISDPKYFWYKEKMVHDLQAAYKLDSGVRIYGGVNNVLNAKPAFDQQSYPNGWEGRFFYLGANFSLDAMK
jgi:iron complex outermembrane receptor protein